MNPLVLILIILLVFAVVGLPGLNVYQHGMGYYPSSVLTAVAVVLLLLLIFR